MPSPTLQQTLDRALSLASERRHQHATLEHLLLALTYDSDAVALLQSAGADLEKLREELTAFLDVDLAVLVSDKPATPERTTGVQRVVRRASVLAQRGQAATGAEALLSLCCEVDSHAVYFLQVQGLVRMDAFRLLVQPKA